MGNQEPCSRLNGRLPQPARPTPLPPQPPSQPSQPPSRPKPERPASMFSQPPIATRRVGLSLPAELDEEVFLVGSDVLGHLHSPISPHTVSPHSPSTTAHSNARNFPSASYANVASHYPADMFESGGYEYGYGYNGPDTDPVEVETSAPAVPAPDVKLCQFHMTGKCRYGDFCRNMHGDQCDKCGRNCLHPLVPDPENQHIGPCIAIDSSKQVECNICFENPVDLKRRFGLLNNCDHAFCLECIRSWRNSIDRPRDVVRACPICRVESHFVIPSDHVPDKEEKEVIINSYRQKLGSVPCRYFKYEEGFSSCPFGSSCFYAHLDSNGKPVEETTRKYLNSEGEVDILKAVRLSDFLT